MSELDAPILCDLAWALARLQYQPSAEWVAAFTARCRRVRGELSEQQRGLLVWAVQQLRLDLPEYLQEAHAVTKPLVTTDRVSGVGRSISVKAGDQLPDLQAKVAKLML
jgi:hypothetical protein